MNSSHISSVLIAIIVPLVLSLLLRSAKPTTIQKDGKKWLAYAKGLKLFSLLPMLISVGVFVITFFVDETQQKSGLFVSMLFGGLGLPLFLEFFGVKIGFDDHSIFCHSPWRKNRIIKWSEIEEVEFSEAAQWWVVKTKNKGNIRLHVYLSGIDEFLSQIEFYKKQTRKN